MPQFSSKTEERSIIFSPVKLTNLAMMVGIIGACVLTTTIPVASSQDLEQSISRNRAIAQGSSSSSEAGITVTGRLEDSSPTMDDDSPYNTHTFEGKAGEQIAILLTSQQFDTYLILRGVDGQNLAKDDDSGGGTNALIVVTLTVSGTYTVFANSFASEARGEYRLQWRTATSADQALVQIVQLAEKAEQLYSEGRYGEAIPLTEQVLDLRQQVLGKNHPDVAISLNDLALLYREQGRYNEAEQLCQQALEIRRTVLGENHPDFATSLISLAGLYQSQGRYSEAEPLFQQALKILRMAVGENDPDFATNLIGLAELYRVQGRYSEAEPLFQQALKIGQTDGEDHPNEAFNLNNLALLYYAQGRYSEAEPLFQQALKIWQTDNENHPNAALSLNNLATIYLLQGRYSEAEPLYQQALKIWQTTLGENYPNVAFSLNNLASLYQAQGRYSEVEPLYRQALTIWQTTLGENHPNVALGLSTLAALYQEQGRYSEAEPLYQQALTIWRTVLGENHPDFAPGLIGLAGLYKEQGRYSEAESLYQQALKVGQTSLGANHPIVALSLNNLALLYEAQGRYSEAESLYQQALKIGQTAFGENHPTIAFSFINLAILNWAQGHLQPALTNWQQGLAIEESDLERNLIGGSEANKRDYLATLDGSIDISLTLHLQYLPQDHAATQLALKTVLQRKGRLLDLFTNSQQTLRNQLDVESQALLDQLNQVRTQISNLYFSEPDSLSKEQYQQQLKELDERSQQLEDQLSRRSATFRTNNAPVDLPTLQSLLPADGVLVEFSRYQIFDPKAAEDERYGEYHYAAYLLQPDGKITGIDLGAAATIDPLIADFSAAVRSPSTSVIQVKEAARALDAVLMAPVRSHLGNQKHLLISPDGPLNLIPFEALVDERDRYLVENFNLTYLTSGRDLLRLQAQAQVQQPPLLLADPIFNQPGQLVSQAPSDTRSSDLSQRSFPPLPETKTEVEAIARLLSGSQLREQSQATEAAVKQADRPQILHIATHGFFEPNTASQSTLFDNPLLRSGLVLAGFQVGQSSGEDGILTALEASSLNLVGTQMVVLSACDTGQGDLSVGEGVYGLRRAFVLAGSESQVISLWRVQDNTTKDLMVAYYEHLMQGKGRSAALREVQLTMLKNEQTAHPYYWAPFIQSGSWHPLR
jgi:CHAT domain-containing protein/Tfp pilus assembly protein PilF